MLKPEENPPITHPADKSLAEFEGTWYIAHTKSRNEKALANQMQRKNISYFLPLVEKVSKKSRRVFKSLLPLFGGYVFFCGNENSRLEVLKTNRVANIIPVNDQQKLIEELLPIEKALKNGLKLQPYEYLTTGQMCRVTAGALMGTEGIIINAQSKTKLILQIEMLGQASCLEIEAGLLEVVDS